MRKIIVNFLWWLVTGCALLAVEVIGYRCIRLNILTEYNNTLYHGRSVVFLLSSEESPVVDISGIKELESFDKCILLLYEYDEYAKNMLLYWGKDALDFSGPAAVAGGASGYAIAGAESGLTPGSTVWYYDKEYRVDYVLNEHINPVVNAGVFAYEDLTDCLPADTAYVLTSSDKGAIAGAYEDLERLCSSEGISVRRLEIPTARYEDYIRFRELYNYLLGFFIIFLAAVCIIHRLIWVRTRKRLNRILLILGDGKIVSRDLMSYGLLIIFSCMGSASVYLGLYGRINIGRSFLAAIVPAFLAVFLLSAAVIPCMGRRTCK